MSEAAKPWAPEKCPITQRPFFMWIEHHKTGEMVPTYGGPYDSYTLAEFDGEDFVCERFDHDAGGWLVDCVEGLGVKLVDDQSLVIDPNNTRYDEIEAFAAAPVAAQPDVTQQTLDDVMAGIPARDAEIEALRKEIEALQAAPVKPYSLDLDPAGIRALTADAISGALALGFQGVNPPPNNEHWLAPFWEIGRESAAQVRQPISGADGLADYPTHGMNLGQLISHVGGRENAQGYVEFGSPMAVHALIQHVLRDFHRQGRVNLAPAQQTTDPLQGAADWLVRGCGVSDPAGLANRLGIGYNRASRLVDAARKEQA